MATTTFRLDELKSQQSFGPLNGITTYDQTLPDVVGLDNGGFAVVYGNDNTVNGPNDYPLVDFFDADFNRVGVGGVGPWTDTQVFLEFAPRITKLANGNVLVVWDEGANGDNDILGRIFTPAGVAVGDPFSVSGIPAETFPDVAGTNDGGFAVVADDATDLTVQKYNANAGFVTDFLIPLSGINLDGRIEALNDGGYAVVWTNTDASRNDGDQAIYTRIFNANGTARTGDILVGDIGVNKKAAIASMPNGNFAVVYADNGYVSGEGITLHILRPDGTEVTTNPIRVDVQLDDVEVNPAVTVFDNNLILVSWTDPTNNNGDITARLFSPTGLPQIVDGGSEITITASGSTDTFSTLANISGSTFIAAWQDSFSDGDGGQISGEALQLVRSIVGDNGNENLQGDAISDDIEGVGGNDTLFGFGGADTLSGGDGADLLKGGGGADEIDGGGGVDIASYIDASGAVTVSLDDGVGAGNFAAGDTLVNIENIVGSQFGDGLTGSAGANSINGLDGQDTIKGLGGADTLDGGAGLDFLEGGAGADVIRTTDNDYAVYQNSVQGVNVNLDTNTASSGDAAGDTFVNIKHLVGSDANDTLTGSSDDNVIFGQDGDDNISGLAGNDVLKGLGGDDTIDGGDGADIISGQAGADSLKGAGGADTFGFANGDGADVLADFDVNSGDVIQLSSNLGANFDSFAEVLAATTDSGAKAIIDFGDGDTITLQGLSRNDLSADDFTFI